MRSVSSVWGVCFDGLILEVGLGATSFRFLGFVVLLFGLDVLLAEVLFAIVLARDLVLLGCVLWRFA